ncbi:MAG: hypothetical protein ACREQL_00115 [Candidatus Binatia bacterium]
MRTLTTLALATAMLVALASPSGATTTPKHHKSHKKSSQAQKDAKAPKADSKAAAPATK